MLVIPRYNEAVIIRERVRIVSIGYPAKNLKIYFSTPRINRNFREVLAGYPEVSL